MNRYPNVRIKDIEDLVELGFLPTEMVYTYKQFVQNWIDATVPNRAIVSEKFEQRYGQKARIVADMLIRMDLLGDSSERHYYLRGIKDAKALIELEQKK